MKWLNWILVLSLLVTVGCAVQVNEITKPARVKKVSDKDNIKQYHVVVSKREGDRNRFRLRRFSPHADFELRVERWRVFYRVQRNLVIVELIGWKQENSLFIEGKEFKL